MYSKKFLSQIYSTLYTIHLFETRCIQLYRQGLIRGYFHPYLGEEAIAVGAWAAIHADDYITSNHRGHGHCIAKGAEVKYMVAELLGKKTGYGKGLGGDGDLDILGPSSYYVGPIRLWENKLKRLIFIVRTKQCLCKT